MRKFLYIMFLAVVLFPMTAHFLKTPFAGSLKGHIVGDKSYFPKFSFEDWFAGDYQRKMENYTKDSTTIAPLLIRYRNQVDLNWYDEVHVNKVYKGKKGFLFYLHPSFIEGHGTKTMDKLKPMVSKLKRVQDSLRVEGKRLLYIFAPEKADVYSEYLPNDKSDLTKALANYYNYLEMFKKNGVEFIDFNKWFKELKGNTEYEIFAKGGKHWAHFYGHKAFDSIRDYLTPDFKIPDFVYLRDKEGDNIWFGLDKDTEKSANLLFEMEDENLALSEKKFENFEGPKALIFTDSYIHSISWAGVLEGQYHKDSEFWYYNRTRHAVKGKQVGSADQKSFDRLAKDTQLFYILISVGNCSYFDYGALDYFK